jgi:hypothetical protein
MVAVVVVVSAVSVCGGGGRGGEGSEACVAGVLLRCPCPTRAASTEELDSVSYPPSPHLRGI